MPRQRARQPEDRQRERRDERRSDQPEAQPARARTAPLDRAADPLDGADHLLFVLGQLERLVLEPVGAVERGMRPGVEPFDGGQRPMGERPVVRVGQDQGGIAERDHDLAPLRLGAFAPQAAGLEPLVFVEGCHLG